MSKMLVITYGSIRIEMPYELPENEVRDYIFGTIQNLISTEYENKKEKEENKEGKNYRLSFITYDLGRKIEAIKIVRAITLLGLKEAKDLIEYGEKKTLIESDNYSNLLNIQNNASQSGVTLSVEECE